MQAYFDRSQIKRIDVNGNGESIYYVLDEDDPNNIITLGMNRILCSDMTIRFVDEELDNISFYIKPEAKFIPPHELTPGLQKLDGFEWRGDQRPSLEDLLTTPPAQPVNEDIPTKLPPSEKLNIEGLKEKRKQTLKSIKNDGE